jgi:hypothetical protein
VRVRAEAISWKVDAVPNERLTQLPLEARPLARARPNRTFKSRATREADSAATFGDARWQSVGGSAKQREGHLA